MFDQQSVGLIKHFLRAYPRRTALLVGLLVLAGLAEGVGLVTLLPVLEVALTDGAGESRLAELITSFVGLIGLQPTLGILLGVIVLGMLLKAAFLWLAAHQVGYTTARIATDLRLTLIRALVYARWSHFTGQPAGYVANSLSREAFRASGAYRELCGLLAGTIQVTVYLAVAFLVSWQVAVGALIAGMLIVFLLRRFVAMGRSAGGEQSKSANTLVARMTDALHGMKAIKAMDRERTVLPLLEREATALNTALRNLVFATETRRAFQEPILVLLIAVGLFAAVNLGDHAVSTLFVMAFLFYRAVGQMNNLQERYQTLAGCESAFWAIMDQSVAAQLQAETSTGTHRPSAVREGIVLEGVSFAYGDHVVLENVSLSIPAGSFVSIVGPSGAGKTTIADLIVGLQPLQSGEILVDGTSIQELHLESWRHITGYVPQEMLLFHESIFQNVTLGADDVTEEQVWVALRKAGAVEFVEALPEGIHSVVGEHGSKLSGGQRQRIAIARALLRSPSLLVLDEVTTALDPATEREICDSLETLKGEATIIAISHQAALREVADRVYHLENGKVRRERETPDSVIADVVLK